MLEVNNLQVICGGKTIVDKVSFGVHEGAWLMIVGPNGAGKSTILSAITQNMDYTGTVIFKGVDIRKMKGQQRAQAIGVLTQSHFVGYDFTVEEVVRLGRYAYAPSPFSTGTVTDNDAVEEALYLTGLTAQRKQSVLTLSGGELQRTFLAQVFAQDPKVLLLDEPTNHLDLVYQKQVFSLISQWLQKPNRAVVSVVHDLSLAKAYGTEALLLHQGHIVTCGPTDSVLCSEHLDPVYKMDVSAWMRQMLGQWR